MSAQSRIPVPANPELPGMPLAKRVNRAEFHLEILRTHGSTDWTTFRGMAIEDFVDFVAELGMEVWYTMPGGHSARHTPMLHAWYTDAAAEAMAFGKIPDDLAGRFVKRAHEHGIFIVSTFNMNMWVGLAALHPEWRIVDIPDGRDIPPNTHHSCHNSPFGQFLADALVDHMKRYDVDGVWFDDTNFGSRNAWPFPAGCLCQWCAEKFRSETGLELPQEVDWSSRDFREWVNWRYENLREFQNWLAKCVRQVKPDASVRFNSYPRPNLPWTTANELQPIQGGAQFFIETDYRTLGAHLNAKIARARGDCEMWGYAPMQLGAENASLGSAPYQDPAFMAKLPLAGLAHGVFTQVAKDYIHPEQSRFMFDEMKKRRNYIGGASLRQCALHLSQQTRDFRYAANPPAFAKHAQQLRQAVADDQKFAGLKDVALFQHAINSVANLADGSDRYWKQWIGAAEMLEQEHVVYDALFDLSLTAEGLAGYRTLVLPNSACLSDDHCKAIGHWVKDGGTLIATYETSLYDELGQKRDNFGLADVLGIDYRGTFDPDGTGGTIYVPQGDLKDQFGIWLGFNGQHTEFDIRAKAVEPLYNLSSWRTFVVPRAGICVDPNNTDIYDSKHPGVTLHRHGKGQAIYVSGDVGHAFADHPLPVHRRFIADLVRRGGMIVEIETHSRLLATAWRADDGNVHVHLYERMMPMTPFDFGHFDVASWSSLDEPHTFGDIKVTLPAGNIRSARMPLRDLDLTVEAGRSVHVPEVRLHDVIVIEQNEGP